MQNTDQQKQKTQLTFQPPASANLETRKDFKISFSREKLREPRDGELQKIKIENILVLPKQSLIQWTMMSFNFDYDEAITHLQKQNESVLDIIAAHESHVNAVKNIQEILNEDQILFKDSYTESDISSKIKNADLVIAIGGDDHIKFVSQLINDTFLLALNSDPQRSVGAITSGSVENLKESLRKLSEGEFLIEDWSRLEATVNGKKLPLACSEIYIGEKESKFGSRSNVQQRPPKFMQTKGSGLIVSTGAGSTGWFESASRYLFTENPQRWPRTERHAEFIQREPYGKLNESSLLTGTLKPGDELTIKSSNNHEGEISIDSISDLPFHRGSVAKIRISDKPLKVISLV